MAGPNQTSVFGRRKEPHTVIIARGDDIRHFTVRPWAAAICGSAFAAIAIAYLLATSYLVLRDDLMGASVARQARMQQSYEDRIAALRAQVDRITSRQMLDQRQMENKVSELLDRQTKLTARHGRLGPVLERAQAAGAQDAPRPVGRPDTRAELRRGGDAPLLAYAAQASDAFATLFDGQGRATIAESDADRADKLFLAINSSLRSIEDEQIAKLRTLTDDAYDKAETITAALEKAGLKADAGYGKEGLGGPLVALTPELAFDTQVAELDQALDKLDAAKAGARRFPIGNPAPGRPISSAFGMRKDPILGTPAMHAGMDFRAAAGFGVKTTAAGTVTKAGPQGGYGRMVEVDHGGGLSTRYAHLSKIRVREGDAVAAGDLVGDVGSSGRSTGPHLHYEVRRDGEATDPLRFLRTGRKLAGLL